MIRVGANRFARFCVNRVVSRVLVRSLSQLYKKSNSLISPDEKTEFSNKGIETSFSSNVSEVAGSEGRNRVMVVVDSSAEAKGALQWALSHSVQTEDTIILLHVIKPSKQGGHSNIENQRALEVLRATKTTCLDRRPGTNVEIEVQQGKEKGPVIVEAARKQKVSLLVLGPKKRSVMWRLKMTWERNKSSSRVVDYCIQNADCMTIALRRKCRKYGGYLITTKRHKNFWLLA